MKRDEILTVIFRIYNKLIILRKLLVSKDSAIIENEISGLRKDPTRISFSATQFSTLKEDETEIDGASELAEIEVKMSD